MARSGHTYVDNITPTQQNRRIRNGVGLVVAPSLCTTPLHYANDFDEERRRRSLISISPHPRTSRQCQGTLTVEASRWHSKTVESEIGLDWLLSHHRSAPHHSAFFLFCTETDLGEENR